MKTQAIGLLGGTFDPIHLGHVHIAEQLREKIPLEHIQFIPCGQPPHRKPPMANPHDRLTMVKLAIADKPHLTVNDIESTRPGPSYTLDTVKALRTIFPNRSLCFILATDEFAHFNEWHKPQEILKYCHLIIVNRNPSEIPKADWVQRLFQAHQVFHPEALLQNLSGKIFVQEIPFLPISATEIREQLRQGKTPKKELHEGVLTYIQKQGLYLKP